MSDTKISRRFAKVTCPATCQVEQPVKTSGKLDFALSRDQLIAMKPAAIVAIVMGTNNNNF